MISDLPDIRIRDAWLLRQNASVYLNELWGNGKPLADDEWIAKRVNEYREAWKVFEHKILTSLMQITGLSYKQNIIDVYVAPWFNALSEPLIIGIYEEPDVFVDLLTHELIHRLLTDNTVFPYDKELIPIWEKLFGNEHSFGTLVHIPVHAILKEIYIDVMNEPERLSRDIDSSNKNSVKDYIEAWDYVEAENYKEIIKKLRVSYGG